MPLEICQEYPFILIKFFIWFKCNSTVLIFKGVLVRFYSNSNLIGLYLRLDSMILSIFLSSLRFAKRVLPSLLNNWALLILKCKPQKFSDERMIRMISNSPYCQIVISYWTYFRDYIDVLPLLIEWPILRCEFWQIPSF